MELPVLQVKGEFGEYLNEFHIPITYGDAKTTPVVGPPLLLLVPLLPPTTTHSRPQFFLCLAQWFVSESMRSYPGGSSPLCVRGLSSSQEIFSFEHMFRHLAHDAPVIPSPLCAFSLAVSMRNRKVKLVHFFFFPIAFFSLGFFILKSGRDIIIAMNSSPPAALASGRPSSKIMSRWPFWFAQ